MTKKQEDKVIELAREIQKLMKRMDAVYIECNKIKIAKIVN